MQQVADYILNNYSKDMITSELIDEIIKMVADKRFSIDNIDIDAVKSLLQSQNS